MRVRQCRKTIVDVAFAAALVWFVSCAKPAPPQPSMVQDTTSSVVTWRTDTIGFGNSYIHDVAIIDDNNIWAVGEFYTKDSTGNLDSTFYNVLIWDGANWNPQRLFVVFQNTKYIRPGHAVFAFAADDIWIAADGPEHWDGHVLNNVNLGSVEWSEVTRIWGRSSSDIYVVGYSGKLSHFNGTSFQSVTTSVLSRFTDIFGNGNEVYMSSENYDNQIQPSGVFAHDASGFRFLFPDATDKSDFQYLQNSFGVWVSPQGTLWSIGDGYVYRPISSHSPVWGSSANGWLLCLRGLSDFDVWAGGVNGLVVHYNGATWRTYTELSSGPIYVEYHSVAVKGNTIVLGGLTLNPDHAILTIGRRVN